MSELNKKIESITGITKEMIAKYGMTEEEVNEKLKEFKKNNEGSFDIFKAHNTEYDYSGFEWPKHIVELERIKSLVQETVVSLKGRSCYEPEIIEAVKAVIYKEKDPVSKTDFAAALVSKLKEDKIVTHEAELSSIKRNVESVLDRVEEKKKVNTLKNNS